MEKRKTTKGTKKIVVIYLLIVIALYVFIYVVPQLSDMFVETYTAQYGTLEIKDQVTCLFIRDEKVYTADVSGTVQRHAERGDLMQIYSKIVSIGDTAYYSDMKGIISYYYDGYEDTLTPDNMTSITYSRLKKIQESEDQMVEATSSKAASGDVLFKVIDNQSWYLLCWIDDENIEKYSEGKTVTVDFCDGDGDEDGTRVTMEIDQIINQKDGNLVILSCTRYYKDFDAYRFKECSVITTSQNGILLETSSIVQVDGVDGVYVVDDYGNYSFKPFKVLAQDGDVTVVTSGSYYDDDGNTVTTISNYAEVLRPETAGLTESQADAGDDGSDSDEGDSSSDNKASEDSEETDTDGD